MCSERIAKEKQELRRLAAQRINAFPEGYLSRAGLEIARYVTELPEYRQANVIFAFCGTEREIDTRPLLARILRDGKRLALPLCTAPGRMEARAVTSLSNLRPGTHGISEPTANSPVIDPSSISLTLVPCLAADLAGDRLGHGGGYYDRYLPACRGAAILLCPEALLVRTVPCDTHDYRLSTVVTEHGVYRHKV